MLWYALALTVSTGFLFGLAPALQVSKHDLNTVIKQDVGSGRSGGRLRGALVGAQIALCVALMIATGLLLRGLYTTYTIHPGFAYEDVAHVSFGLDGGPDILDRRLMDDIAALPGVESVAYATQTPLGESITGFRVRLPGQAESEFRWIEMDAVTPSYFPLLELPIVRGRNFTEAESADSEREAATRPVIVTETTARNYWGDKDPLGRTLLWEDTTLEVVGVTADARLGALGEIDQYYLFVPRWDQGELLVKSRAGFAETVSSILAIVKARDPNLAARVLPLESNVGYFRGLSRIVTTLGGSLGALALLLAAVGVYGVVSYSVTRRYRELGIRLALGARARGLMVMLLRRTMRPVMIGAVAGVVAAAALTRILSAVLFGVSPADPIGFGGAVLLVVAVALVAGALAARPALRTNPMVALRYE